MPQPARSDRVLDNVVVATVLSGLADIATWTAVGPISVARIGVLVTVAQTGAQPVIRFDLRPTYGSDTGRVNGKFGAFQFPAGGVAAGKTVSMESRGKVDAGQQVVAVVATVGGAGSVIPFLEWEARSENAANQVQVSGTMVITPAAFMAGGEQVWESPEEEELRKEREEEEQIARLEAREDAQFEHERRLRETPEERGQRREREAQERQQARAEARQRREQERQEREQAQPDPAQLPAQPAPQPA